MRIFTCLICTLWLVQSLSAQKVNRSLLEDKARQTAQGSLDLLVEFLSIPNDANYPEFVESNARWLETELAERDFNTERLETPSSPLLLAERNIRRAKGTVLVYFHADGQPVDTGRWEQESPYQPVIKEWDEEGHWRNADSQSWDEDHRIFARSASDDKGPIIMFLAAVDALEEINAGPDFNIKLIIDFEEEMGSPHLPEAVEKYKDKLTADRLIIFDGPRHITNQPTLTFGARGISTITLTTYGPIVPQHSGHYGNYVPNPAFRLARLLASMKEEDGRVSIPGYYDGIELTSEVKEILAAVPDDEEQIRNRMQVAALEKVGDTYQESIQYPSLNIRGMQSGWIDEEVRTIVPAWARAELDIRLVLESDPERLIELVKNHIEDQGYHVIDHEPTREERLEYDKIARFNSRISYQSFRTPIDSEIGDWLTDALRRAFGKEPIRNRISGGSIPISPFVNTLGIPAVTIPTVNRDNNQHSPNENLRLGNYREGIQTIMAILTEDF